MRKKKRSGVGLINGCLNFLSEKIMSLVKSGLIGKIFSSSDTLENKAARGIIIGPIDASASGEISSFRRKNLSLTGESVFATAIRKLLGYLGACELSWYGVYFMIFALYSMLLYIVKVLIIQEGDVSPGALIGEHTIVSALILIASIPLLRCNESLKSAVYHSGLIRPFFEHFVGISENKFEDPSPVNKATGYFAAITLGILTGGITYYTSPLTVLLVLCAVLMFILVMSFPELGLIVTILVSPFLGFFDHPTIILVCLVIIDFIAYISKVLIGKRVFRVRLVDAMVILFGVLFLMGGIITSGGTDSLKAALIYFALMLIYFLVVNLFDTREWLYRSVVAVAVPSVLVALYGIIGYAVVNMPSKWLDTAMFSGITSRAVSVFENPNMLATYLILTAPFVWMCAFNKKLSPKLRTAALIGAIASMVCVIMTWSRGAWLGIIVAIILFVLVNYKYSLKYILAIALTSPIWVGFIPRTVATRFLSIGNLADSSTYYRLYTWKGSLKLLADYWMCGIGVGEAAFTQIYPLYSYVGIDSTVHSHNIFLQIAIELGVVALLIFVFAMFLTVQKGFWTLKSASEKSIKLFASAALSGLVAALVHGMVDYIWYNYRVFFAFWVVVALVCACANVCKNEKMRNGEYLIDTREKSLYLDIIF